MEVALLKWRAGVEEWCPDCGLLVSLTAELRNFWGEERAGRDDPGSMASSLLTLALRRRCATLMTYRLQWRASLARDHSVETFLIL